MPRIIASAAKRGEPLRERRPWRSRRKAGRAARSRWVDDEAARGTRSPTRFAPPEALSAAARPARKKNGAARTPFTCRQHRSVKLGADLAAQLDRAVHVTVRHARANGADHVVEVARRYKLRSDRLDIGGRERSSDGAATPCGTSSVPNASAKWRIASGLSWRTSSSRRRR